MRRARVDHAEDPPVRHEVGIAPPEHNAAQPRAARELDGLPKDEPRGRRHGDHGVPVRGNAGKDLVAVAGPDRMDGPDLNRHLVGGAGRWKRLDEGVRDFAASLIRPEHLVGDPAAIGRERRFDEQARLHVRERRRAAVLHRQHPQRGLTILHDREQQVRVVGRRGLRDVNRSGFRPGQPLGSARAVSALAEDPGVAFPIGLEDDPLGIAGPYGRTALPAEGQAPNRAGA